MGRCTSTDHRFAYKDCSVCRSSHFNEAVYFCLFEIRMGISMLSHFPIILHLNPQFDSFSNNSSLYRFPPWLSRIQTDRHIVVWLSRRINFFGAHRSISSGGDREQSPWHLSNYSRMTMETDIRICPPALLMPWTWAIIGKTKRQSRFHMILLKWPYLG